MNIPDLDEFMPLTNDSFGTGLVRHCPQGLFSPFFTFLRVIFFRPFRLSLVPTICPWVSEDVERWECLWKLLFLGVVIWIVDLAPYFSHPTGTSAILNAKATIPDKSSWEGCTQLNLVHFNPQKKRVSSFAKYPRTITRTNVKLFLDIGPGAGEGRKGKKRGQK